MSRKMCCLLLLLLPSLGMAHEVPDVRPMLARLEAACPGYADMYPYAQLKSLQALPQAEDWRLQQDLDELQWAGLKNTPACKTALLQNTMEGMAYVLKTVSEGSHWTDSAQRDLAESMLIHAVLAQPADKAAQIARGEQLLRTYVDHQPADDAAKSLSYYFASHAYIQAAKEAVQPDDAQAMLVQAVRVAREGLAKATDTTEIVEPLGIALGEQAKRLPKGSPEYRRAVEESLSTFEQIRKVDPLAPYNIAVDRVLLGDYAAARKELTGMADAGTIDNKVCSGLLTDADLKPLVADDKDWYIAFFKGHCGALIQKLQATQRVTPLPPGVPPNR